MGRGGLGPVNLTTPGRHHPTLHLDRLQFIRDDAVIKTNSHLVNAVCLVVLLAGEAPFDLHFTLSYRRVPPEEIAHALCSFSTIHQHYSDTL